jgi:hypothetical protein
MLFKLMLHGKSQDSPHLKYIDSQGAACSPPEESHTTSTLFGFGLDGIVEAFCHAKSGIVMKHQIKIDKYCRKFIH